MGDKDNTEISVMEASEVRSQRHSHCDGIVTLQPKTNNRIMLPATVRKALRIICCVYSLARTPASWSQPGSLDETFNPGSGISGIVNVVNAITAQPDGQLVAGGYFFSVNGITRNRIARLKHDGSLDLSSDPGDGPDGPVQALSLQSDGKF